LLAKSTNPSVQLYPLFEALLFFSNPFKLNMSALDINKNELEFSEVETDMSGAKSGKGKNNSMHLLFSRFFTLCYDE